MRRKEIDYVTETYFTTDENLEYTVTYVMEVYCVRAGTYSVKAEDPEEFYGVYEYRLFEIESVEVYDEKTEEMTYLEDIPVWLKYEVEREVESFY
jgi:hypothetical protein